MFRIYKNYIKQLLLTLVYARDNVQTDSQHIYDYCRRNWSNPAGVPPEQVAAKTAVNIITRHDGSFTLDPIDQLIDTLSAMVSDSYQGTRDKLEGDLIDELVKVLNLPLRVNRIGVSGSKIQRLQQALLLPSELAAMRGSLLAGELTCQQCGTAFVRGQAGTIMLGEDGGVTLSCMSCQWPSIVRCIECGEPKAITTRDQKSLHRIAQCGCHLKKEGEGEARVRGADEPNPFEEPTVRPTIRVGSAASPFVTRRIVSSSVGTAPGGRTTAGRITVTPPADGRSISQRMRDHPEQIRQEQQRDELRRMMAETARAVITMPTTGGDSQGDG